MLPILALQELKQQYMAIVQCNMLITAELFRIMKLLQEKGIEALAQMAYEDITLRQSTFLKYPFCPLKGPFKHYFILVLSWIYFDFNRLPRSDPGTLCTL